MPDRAKRPRGPGPFATGTRPLADMASRILADLGDLVRVLASEAGLPVDLRDPELVVTFPVEVRIGPQVAHADDARAFLAEARRRVGDALRGQGHFRMGHVYCFQCDKPDCEHSTPSDPTMVFRGYTTGGRPVFQRFPDLLSERDDPRLELLYATPPVVTALVLSEAELAGDYLTGFASDDFAYRLRGEVVLGLLPLLREARCAITVQVVETRGPGQRRRLRLNVIGLRPDDLASAMGDSLAAPAQALARTFQAAQDRLDAIGRRSADLHRRGFPDGMDDGVRPLLTRLRSDLERIFRAASRRTRHAEERHSTRARPTGQALQDALDAPADKVFLDTRHDTVVVLGPRGRTHVFTRDGRLVTSLVLTPGEVARRSGQARWKVLDTSEVTRWRERLSR